MEAHQRFQGIPLFVPSPRFPIPRLPPGHRRRFHVFRSRLQTAGDQTALVCLIQSDLVVSVLSSGGPYIESVKVAALISQVLCNVSSSDAPGGSATMLMMAAGGSRTLSSLK